jgi:DNA-binding PadR family transcriptional regulator
MTIDARARVLKTTDSNPCGVKEVVQKLDLRASSVLSLLERMQEEGLIILESRHSGRGRPKKIVKPTVLGREFLEAYEKLKTKPLKAKKSDLRHAMDDALYAKRLVERGHSPFELFMELNNIVYNIKGSSEAR